MLRLLQTMKRSQVKNMMVLILLNLLFHLLNVVFVRV
uniref:Uncharacterized protein n=1 Tax=Siphoviridae sp. ctxMM9 TaxID=2827973 RepID=A0A8S5T7Q9_9CAUD|nr:MAG TPA: hypothetical protein [Siphoviridae sp. ctxMM9]